VGRLIIIALFLAFFGQLCCGARHLSLTSDEPAHFISGYSYLATGDLWTIPPHGHPPLINIWSAWLLFLQPEHPDPRLLPYWGEDLILYFRAAWSQFGPVERIECLIRYPIMLLAMLLAALVCRWAHERYGNWGAVLAATAMTWDPLMIAHAQLDTTDLGMTLLAFGTFYLLDLFLKQRSWSVLMGIGLCLGAVMGAKASGLMVLPLALAFLGWGWFHTANRRQQIGPWLGYMSVVVMLAVVVLWALYRFEWGPLPGTGISVPFPSHIQMLDIFFRGTARRAFLWGEIRTGGWWWYFPVAFAIKTPLPLIGAFIAATWLAFHSPRRWLLAETALWFFPLVYLVTAIQGGVNIGYRHLLPIAPFAYVHLARLGPWLAQGVSLRLRQLKMTLAAVLGLWYVVGTMHVYPFALAYFNELVGGPRQGYHYLVDSNVDWGQSYKALRQFMDQTGIQEIWLSYFTWVDPAVYGVHYRPLFPGWGTEPVMPQRYDPSPGFYAISATTLQGIALKEHDPDLYEWFRHQEPLAQLGYGLLVYQVMPHDPTAHWIAQCTIPVVPLSSASIESGFGRDDLRKVTFDCSQSWVYPESGKTTGWYGLFRATWLNGDDFIIDSLASARLSYQQREFHELPAFALFEQSRPPTLQGLITTVRTAPSNWPLERIGTEGTVLVAPVSMTGPLTFLGSQVKAQGRTIELWTFWRVEGAPLRPVSIMAHLLDQTGQVVAVGDGLGFPIEQWCAGDIIVQRAYLSAPAPGCYEVQTGIYWLDTLERWSMRDAIGDRLLLSSITVK
jgi:4-amino-4-deoxy-L-arabinose transferase-like glycosyltransferase